MRILAVILILLSGCSLFSQNLCVYIDVFGKKHYPEHPFNASYDKFYHKPAKEDSLTEPDVMMATQFIKVLDFKEKTNQMLFQNFDAKNHYYALFDILVYGIQQERISAFKTNAFSKPKAAPLTCEQVNSRIFYLDSIHEFQVDSNGNEKEVKVLKASFLNATDIKEFHINEVWYFNKKWSRIEKRIIGLCPVWHNPKTDKDEELFWVYYPEAKDLLAHFRTKSKSTHSDIKSYEELFAQRFFNSYIKKESNIFNRDKVENGKGIDDLIQSEKAKENVLRKEEDFWEK